MVKNYNGLCHFFYVEGNHNDIHEDSVYLNICRFFQSVIETESYKPDVETEKKKETLSPDSIFSRSLRCKTSSKIIMEKNFDSELDMKHLVKKLFERCE